MDRHPEEVPVPESLRDLGGAFGQRQRRVRIAAEAEHRGLEEHGEPELDAIGQVRRVPLGAREPSGADRRLLPDEVLDAQPRRHPRGATIVARLRVAGVRLLAGRHRLLDPPGPPGRVGEPLAVLGTFERLERAEQLVRLGPRARVHRGSRAVDVRDALGHAASFESNAVAPEAGDSLAPTGAQPRSSVSRSGCLSHTAVPAATGARSSTTIAARLALAPQSVRPTARHRSAQTGRAISAVR